MRQWMIIFTVILAGLLPVLPLYAFVPRLPVSLSVFRPTETGPSTVSFGLDLAALASSVTNEAGARVSLLVRDIPARAVTETDITGQKTVIRSDTAGRVTSVSRPDGVLVSNTVNVLGQPVSVLHNGAEVLGMAWRADGVLLAASNAASSLAWSRNASGLATNEAAHNSSFGFQVSRTLSAAALPTNITLSVESCELSVGRSFDQAERLASVSTGSAGAPPAIALSFALSYSPQDGGLSSVSNAVFAETQSRDLLGRVTNIAYRTHAGALLASFDYKRDVTGSITQKVSTVGLASPPATNSYAYDALDRLTSADGETYTYDLAGNRLTRTGLPPVTYAHNKPVGILHDLAGNVANYTRDGISYALAWNTQGQLLSVTTNGVLAESYTYAPLGRRLSTTDLSGTIYHIYDGDHCAADVDSDGQPLRLYTWGGGIDNLLAVTVISGASTNTYYTIRDHLNTVHALVDSLGNIAESYTYDAWGNVQSAVGGGQLAVSNRFLWQGREYSHATGLYNFRARWYSPEWGRWLSPDPLGLESGLNLYEFCRNNPVNLKDPWGEEVYYSALGGIHAKLLYSDPGSSTGYSSFGFHGQDAYWPRKDYSFAKNFLGMANAFYSEGMSEKQTGVRTDQELSGGQYIKVNMTCEEEKKMRDAIDDFEAGHYGIIGRNCANVIQNVLHESGYFSGCSEKFVGEFWLWQVPHRMKQSYFKHFFSPKSV